MKQDRFGNRHSPGVPYARGAIVTSTQDDLTKLQVAWRHIRARDGADGAEVYNFSGLERGMPPLDAAPGMLDDEIAPALYGDRLTALALDHLGGDPDRHDVMVMNRQTAAILAATLVMVEPGDTIVGVSPTYSHPCVVRAAQRAGANFVDTVGFAAFRNAMKQSDRVSLVALTRLAVSYEILQQDDIFRIVELAHEADARVLVDDAGGARVGPAIFDQPRSLELGADVASTGLDKYGTIGPRLGVLAGERAIVADIRACAFELGVEARPMLYPAVVRSLEQYDPQRVRDLVAATKQVAEALKARLGNRVTETPVIAQLQGEDILEMAMERAGDTTPVIVPYEATAALAMILLRDHGILTVHFAGMPPGTGALLIKFVPPETLERFGGPAELASAIDRSIDTLSSMISDTTAIREMLLNSEAPRPR